MVEYLQGRRKALRRQSIGQEVQAVGCEQWPAPPMLSLLRALRHP